MFVFVGITVLLFFGYRITRDWQQGVAARITHQNEENATLIMTAITHDMRGVQARILANRDWDAPLPDESARDMTEQVATTFARYPYTESFFTWRGEHDKMLFFIQAGRVPAWMSQQIAVVNSPIVLVFDPPIGDQVRQRVLSSVAGQLRYAVFNTELAGVPYQIVARITYADSLRERMDSVSGFTVNLNWIRKSYFSDILSEVGFSAGGGLTEDIALLDENDRTVLGSNNQIAPVAERTFPLLFMDSSDNAADLPPDLTNSQWKL
jgi:hypothetical protein